jgi:hypothetical protein
VDRAARSLDKTRPGQKAGRLINNLGLSASEPSLLLPANEATHHQAGQPKFDKQKERRGERVGEQIPRL